MGNNLNDIKEFIKAQPPSTVVAVGYISNAGVNVLRISPLTTNKAIKAIRPPRGTFSSMDSPYLSLIKIVKGWPQQSVRSWDLQLGLGGLCKVAEKTGGECDSMSTSTLVGFKPYLDQFQKSLENQYDLAFLATPRKNAGFQRVNILTEVPKSEILAPDNVWVPAAGKTGQ